MWKQTKFRVSDHSHVGEVRRFAQEAAAAKKFDEILTGKVSIVATELGTNIVKHAGGGEMILIETPETIHLLCLDKGPGIANLDRSMTDGYSTGGTAGNGLGAIKRGATSYDIFTHEKSGTVIHAAFSEKTDPNENVGALCVPYPGEAVAGDSWAMIRDGQKLRLILADGLGHGLLAHEASHLACTIFLENEYSQDALIQQLHLALRSTRGAAVTVADIDFGTKVISYCGVGNVAGATKGPGSGRKLVNYNGTVGLQLRKIQSMTYPLDKDEVFVLASDGISTSWSLENYPGLLHRDAFTIAGVLYRDFGKNNDDMSVIVVKESER